MWFIWDTDTGYDNDYYNDKNDDDYNDNETNTDVHNVLLMKTLMTIMKMINLISKRGDL